MNTRSTSLVSKTGKAKSPKYAIVAFRESLTCAIYDIEKLDKPRKKVSGVTIKVEVNDGLRKGTIVSTADDFEILLVRLQKVNVTSFFGISKRKIGITNITTHKTQAPNVSIKRLTETQSTKRRRTDENCTSTRIQCPRSIHSDVPHPHTTNNLISPKSPSIDLPISTLLSDSNLNSQESSLLKSISSITPQSELSSIPSSPLTISTPTRITNTPSPDSSGGYLLSQNYYSSTSDTQNSLPPPHGTPEGSFSGYLSSQDDPSTSDIQNSLPSPYDVATSEGSFSGTEYRTRETPSGYLSSQDDLSTSDIYIPPPSPYDVATPEGSFSEVELLSTISPPPADTPSTGYLVFQDDSSTSDIQNSLPSLHYTTTPEGSFCETESRTRSGYLSSQDDSSNSDIDIPPPSPYDIATPEGPLSGTAASNQPESLTRDTLSQLPRFDILPEGSFSDEVELLSTISPPPADTPSTGYVVFPDNSSTSDIQNSLPSLHYTTTPEGSFNGTESRTRETPSGYLPSQDDLSTSDIDIPPPPPYDIATPEGSFSGAAASNQSESLTGDILSQTTLVDLLPEGSFSDEVELLSPIPPSPLTPTNPPSTDSTSGYLVFPSNPHNSVPSPHDIATPEGSFCETVSPDPRTSETPSPLSLFDITTPEGLFSDDISTPTDKDCDIHQQLSIIKPLKYTSPTEFLGLEQHPTPFTENNNKDSTNPLSNLPPVPVRQLNTMNELVDKHKSFTPSAATTIPSTTSAVPTIPLLPHHHHQTTIPHQSSASLRETKPNNVPITDPEFMKLKVIQIMGPNLDTDIIQSRIDDLPEEGAEDKSTPYIISEYILKDAFIESHMIPERFAVKLLDRIFTLEELEGRNVYGTHHVTKGALDRRKIAAIDEAVKSIFPGTYHIWKICVKRINSHIRYVLQKIPQLYKKTPKLSFDGNSS